MNIFPKAGRLPLLPTILVGLAAAAMVALGLWQLRRAGEKDAMFARIEAAMAAPPAPLPQELDDGLDWRRFRVECAALEPAGEISLYGETPRGARLVNLYRCDRGDADPLLVAAGLSNRVAGNVPPPLPPRGFAGRLLINVGNAPLPVLYAEDAAVGAGAVAQPDPGRIADNHLLYALQWFFFAAAAVVVYGLALRKRRGRA
ncbi:MAG: SURF1 family cytochrome oxidase biogenesis protein [Sphingomonadaceae bacterium]